ncbi:8-oxo-dGTP diphosphatase MutT [Heliorestis convoluta]|uniref:8-oxo-dGTP diphosphatase n=1 Tax=Heliorestis convoluta TaxID=356322 RepID=A0A5Q2N126_9FIRM|nr:8-oxo-dGTP diphosphatase MutT [Heliorestis convoluta]QGG49064.1 NUDIX hydrolase [Heliorestis convoluta]
MIDVAAAIMLSKGRIFIAQRPAGDVLEDKWEFPGGKIEAGERPEETLVREMEEEFGIVIKVHEFFDKTTYRYPHATVRLHAYWAEVIQGELELRVHRAGAWVDAEELKEYDFAPADIPFVQKLVEKGSLITK